MKTMNKLSVIVVFGAAIASASFAQSNHRDRSPAPARTAPMTRSVQAPRAQAVRSFAQPNRSTQPARFGDQNPGPATREFARPHTTPAVNWATEPTRTQTTFGAANRTSVSTNRTFTRTQVDGNSAGRGDSRTRSSSTGGNEGWNKGAYGDNGNRGNRDGDNSRGANGSWAHVQHFDGNRDDAYRRDYDRRPDFGGAFHFGLYLSAPTVDCVVSPWYNYPVLPAYLPVSAVYVNTGVTCNWFAGSPYSSSYGYNSSLNLAVSDITAMFQNQSVTALDALIPPSGQVNIFNDGDYMYSLNDSDFRQMMQDNLQNTETSSFVVTNVLADGSQATVDCAHTFSDPDGGTKTVYQQYRLQIENGRYVIVDFSTHA